MQDDSEMLGSLMGHNKNTKNLDIMENEFHAARKDHLNRPRPMYEVEANFMTDRAHPCSNLKNDLNEIKKVSKKKNA